MIRLQTLGPVDLRAEDGRRVQSVLHQPKRLALFIYLAMKGPGTFTRRDKLFPVFWPDRDQASARNALNQALHKLRRSLGPGVVVSRGREEVGLAADRVWCDAVALLEAIAIGDQRRAVELYKGEFLDGFFVQASAEFEQWVDKCRSELRSSAEEVAVRRGAEARELAPSPPPASQGDPSRRPRSSSPGVIVASAMVGLVLLLAFSADTFGPRDRPEAEESSAPSASDRVTVHLQPFSVLTSGDMWDNVPEAFEAALRRHLVEAGVALGPDPLSPLATSGLLQNPRIRDIPILLRGGLSGDPTQLRIQLEVVDGRSGGTLAVHLLERSAEDPATPEAMAWEASRIVRDVIGREVSRRARLCGPKANPLLDQAEEHLARARRFTGRGPPEPPMLSLAYADSLLEKVETGTGLCTSATVARARIAAEGAWVSFVTAPSDSAGIDRFLAKGLHHADRLLSLDPTHAGGLELRATLRHWHLVMGRAYGPEADSLVDAAEEDLRAAVSADPNRVHAWNLLADIHYLRGRFADALWAATNAYEADAYLRSPVAILNRLFASAFEVGEDDAARTWCRELERTAPGDWTSGYCRLKLLAWVADPPEIAGADLEESITRWAATSPQPGVTTRRFQMLAATALARAGMPDSARAIAQHVLTMAENDEPEFVHLLAEYHMALGELTTARAVLEEYVQEAPLTRSHLLKSRRFTRLQSTLVPGFGDDPPSVP